MTTPIPLADQAAKLDRILDERVGFYRLGVKKGTLALDVAARKHAEVEAIRKSFAFLVANAGWIRAEAQRRREMREAEAEIESLREHPAVQSVLTEFPGAEVTGVHHLEPTP